MRKVIAAINMSLDGYCDHTVGIADEEIHQHYAGLLNNSGTALFGRITYQLMEYWRSVVENPTGNKAMDNFAVVIDRLPKIVYSHTLQNADWKSATLANRGLEEEVIALKQQEGKDIFIGSRSLIIQLMNLKLVDEFQICVHPVIAGHGLPLFNKINEKIMLKLSKTKVFGCGAVVLYYETPQS